MDPRLPLAVLAVVTLLLGSVVVTSQVEDDLNAELDARGLFDDARFNAPDASNTKLDLEDFTLPEDLDVRIPEGTEIDADLRELKLDKPLTLDLPPGFPLEDLPFSLPEDFRLELPEGSVIDASGLTLPRGAHLALPDGSRLIIPPGARLDLPPVAMERLFAAGLEPGRLDAPVSADVTGIPEDAQGTLDLPALEDGGTITLPPGTVLKVPEDAPFPFPDGVLPRGFPWTLPAGTAFDWPALLAGSRGFTEFPAVQGGDGFGTRPVRSCAGCRPVETEITSAYPERMRKTEPFPVEGFVVDAQTGEGLAGVPVDVFLNATKEEPGWPAGVGVTNADGRYRVDARVPDDLPSGDYQLVARSRPFERDGARFDEGWSDPPVSFLAATALTLDVPAVDGVGARVPVRGTLLDEAGAPVAETLVDVYADDARAARAITDASGAFEAGVTFREPGAHVVTARFTGTPALEPSDATADLRIVDYALDVPGTVMVVRGGSVTLGGRVLSGGGGFSGAHVEIATPFGSTLTAVTGSDGRFSARLPVPADAVPESHELRYRLVEQDLVKAQQLRVLVAGALELDVPARVVAGGELEVTFGFRAADGRVVHDGVPVTVSVAGPDGVVVRHARAPGDPAEQAALVFPAASAGRYTVSVTSASPLVDAAPASAAVHAGVLDVDWAVPAFAVRGEAVTLAGRVLIDGEPAAGSAFTLAFTDVHHGTLDAGGGFSVREDVSRKAAPGPRDVQFLLGHAKGTAPVPDPLVDASESLAVKIRPRLEIDAPRSYTPDGEPLDVTVRFVDDGGSPLAMTAVDFRVTSEEDGAQWPAEPTAGSSTGVRELTVDAPPGGHLLLRATVDGNDHYTSASAESRVRDGTIGISGFAARVMTPVTGFLVLGLALAGGGAWWWWRRGRGDEPAAFATDADPGPEYDVPLRWPDLEEDVPPVFGVGEVVRVAAEEPVAWTLGEDALGEAAEVELRLPREPGPRRLVASAPDGRRTVTRVRVVRYETEIAREFDALLDALADVAPTLSVKATPREAESVLLDVAPPRAVKHVDALVSVMEVANYADARVTRAHYVRFHRAADALKSLLGPRETSARLAAAGATGTEGSLG